MELTGNISNISYYEDVFSLAERIIKLTNSLTKFLELAIVFMFIITVFTTFHVLLAFHWIREVTPVSRIKFSLAIINIFSFCAALILAFMLEGANKTKDLESAKYKNAFWFVVSLDATIAMSEILHIIFMSVVNYLKIMKELIYRNYASKRNINIALVLIWLIPAFYYFIYFYVLGFYFKRSNEKIVEESSFGIYVYYIFMLSCITAMAYIHGHLIRLLRSEERKWLEMEEQGLMRRHGGGNRQQLNNNSKAIHTSLYILGTFVLFWLLELFLRYLTKKATEEERYIDIQSGMILLALCDAAKSITNSLIYWLKTPEIKEAAKRMDAEVRKKLCCKRYKL